MSRFGERLSPEFLTELWSKKEEMLEELGLSEETALLRDRLRTAAKVLRSYPLNYSRVARALKIPRTEVLQMVEDYPEVFEMVQDSFLDELTSSFMNVVSGRKDAKKGFNVNNAHRVLKGLRPLEWGNNPLGLLPPKKELVHRQSDTLFGEPVVDHVGTFTERLGVEDLLARKGEDDALGIEDDIGILEGEIIEGEYEEVCSESGEEESEFITEGAREEESEPTTGYGIDPGGDGGGEQAKDPYIFTEADFGKGR